MTRDLYRFLDSYYTRLKDKIWLEDRSTIFWFIVCNILANYFYPRERAGCQSWSRHSRLKFSVHDCLWMIQGCHGAPTTPKSWAECLALSKPFFFIMMLQSCLSFLLNLLQVDHSMIEYRRWTSASQCGFHDFVNRCSWDEPVNALCNATPVFNTTNNMSL